MACHGTDFRTSSKNSWKWLHFGWLADPLTYENMLFVNNELLPAFYVGAKIVAPGDLNPLNPNNKC
jgi:hypothetical protein